MMKKSDSQDNAQDNDLTEQVMSQLFAANRLLHILSIPELKESGLRPPQAIFLGVLLQAGLLNMSSISRVTNVTLSVATRFIARLEKNGMVERVPDEADRRLVIVRLTDEGKRVAESLLQAQTRHLHDALVGIAREDLEVFVSVLSRANQRLVAELPSQQTARRE